MKYTYIGGPSALLELGGLRLLTDPTFEGAFANAGMKGRLRWMEPGCATDLSN